MMPIDVDRWMFGGHLPTEVLQHAWCGNPCDPASDPRWYDLFFTTVYASHFVTGLTIAAVLWVRNRDEFARWMRRLVAISYAALAIYIAYPMAPPWWASRDGYLDADLPRITGRGWEDIGIDRLNLLLGGVGNKVAAMPSLHAGIAFLVAAYADHAAALAGGAGCWSLYPVAMGVALVYFAEHYVIDVLAGWLVAVLVLVGLRLVGAASRRCAEPTATDRYSSVCFAQRLTPASTASSSIAASSVLGQRRAAEGVEVGVELLDRRRADHGRGHPRVAQRPLQRQLGELLAAPLGDLVEPRARGASVSSSSWRRGWSSPSRAARESAGTPSR